MQLFLLSIPALMAGLLPVETRSSKSPDGQAQDPAAFLSEVNREMAHLVNLYTVASWDYVSNLTKENLEIKLKASQKMAKVSKKFWADARLFNWTTFDNDLKRQFQSVSVIGSHALPDEKLDQYDKTVAKMQEIYSTAKVCAFGDPTKCDLSLEPELTKILQTSRNPDELKHVWLSWRNAVGPKCKQLFSDYVALVNEAAKLNGFEDGSELWKYDYESLSFESDIEQLWHQIEPLYKEIHAYVRSKLYTLYGPEVVSKTGPIPAHLLGNMWAQSWSEIYDIVKPFGNISEESVTEEMVKQEFTPLKMFQLSDQFFQTLNFSAMTPTFWNKSIIEKPTDREIVCHASAWDFHKDDDFRIKMCTEIDVRDLRVVHHEMGHVQYFMEYKDQPFLFRGGANPGFHEAVGDVIGLSVLSPSHLKKIGLKKNGSETQEKVINNLMEKALDKLVFLPFGYLVDKYRWDIFKGKISPNSYNREWWKLREEYQGIQPPVARSEDDFDAAAKYHVAAGATYVAYFVAHVIQFQFHKALCIAAGQYDPQNPGNLYNCDIYESVEAGNKLRAMLQLGSSQHWEVAMEKITGQTKMDAGPLIEYFKPLYDWLKEENRKNGETIGWSSSNN